MLSTHYWLIIIVLSVQVLLCAIVLEALVRLYRAGPRPPIRKYQAHLGSTYHRVYCWWPRVVRELGDDGYWRDLGRQRGWLYRTPVEAHPSDKYWYVTPAFVADTIDSDARVFKVGNRGAITYDRRT